MSAILFSIPISATDGNIFTYTGNVTGAMSTYNNNISAIFAGAAGVNPSIIYDEYNPLTPQFNTISNFQSGRTYQVVGKRPTFNLGVSGTRTVALPDKRYIHGRAEGGVGSSVNMIGFDDTMLSTPVSSAFSKSAALVSLDGGVQIYAQNDSVSRTSFKVWTPALQALIDAGRPVSDDVIKRLEPLSSYIVLNYTNNIVTTISAVRSKNYLLSNEKDFQNDNIFITTNDGRYLSV
jgi:hypothetical protein